MMGRRDPEAFLLSVYLSVCLSVCIYSFIHSFIHSILSLFHFIRNPNIREGQCDASDRAVP